MLGINRSIIRSDNCDVIGPLWPHQKAASCVGWDQSIWDTRCLSRTPRCMRQDGLTTVSSRTPRCMRQDGLTTVSSLKGEFLYQEKLSLYWFSVILLYFCCRYGRMCCWLDPTGPMIVGVWQTQTMKKIAGIGQLDSLSWLPRRWGSPALEDSISLTLPVDWHMLRQTRSESSAQTLYILESFAQESFLRSTLVTLSHVHNYCNITCHVPLLDVW